MAGEEKFFFILVVVVQYKYTYIILPEMYKRERERLVHTFTHERGSILAHVFAQVLVHKRE